MTGRLINADAIPWLSDCKHPHVEGFQTVRKMAVDNMPTVDAIPIEWIKQFVKKENIDIIHKVGIVYMVDQWKLHPIDFEISSEDAIPISWLTAQAENPSNSDELRNAIDHIVYKLWAERKEDGTD